MRKITTFEQRQKFKCLCNQIKNGCSIDHIVNQLSGTRGVMPFSTFSCSDIANDPIYRARINLNGKLFKNVGELSYPPSSITKKGRCNREGESILYASTSELGTIVENVAAGMGLDTLFTIACVKKRSVDSKLVFKSFGIQGQYNNLDRYAKEFNDFCNAEFSKIFNKNCVSENLENDYNFTIALNEHFTNQRIVTINPITKKSEEINFHMALAYPSVHSELITNKTVYNLAIKPEIFDLYYEIYEAFTYVLIHEKEHNYIMLTPLNKAEVKNSELFWEYTYNEMIQRAKNGNGWGEIKSDYVKNFLRKIF